MSIKLDWLPGDPQITSYKVYRSEDRFKPDVLPAAYATLPASAVSFEDTNVAIGKLYYYRVSGIKGGKELVSFIKPMAYVPDRGPGPKEILRGDWEWGYFGTLNQGEFGSPADVLFEMKRNGLTVKYWSPSTPAGENEYWCKFASKGRVVYIYAFAFGDNPTWKTLYDAGIAGGGTPADQIPEVVKTAYGTVTKDFRIFMRDKQFRIRLPESRNKWTDTLDSDLWQETGSRRAGEFDHLFMAIWGTDYDGYQDKPPFLGRETPGFSGSSGILCKEMYAADPSKVILRQAIGSGNFLGYMQSVSATVFPNLWGGCFQPVIELIQE